MENNKTNPAGPAQAPENVQTATEEFKKKIEESKAVLQAEAEAPTQKRGRGRPRKIKLEEKSGPVLEPTGENPTSIPAPDISVYLKQPIIMVSKVPAIKYKIPELQFTEDEAGACAEALNNMVQAFVPDVNKMDPKTASVVSAAAVFGSIGFQKYSIYVAKRREMMMSNPPPENPVDEVQNQVKEAQNTNPIAAESYFSRQNV